MKEDLQMGNMLFFKIHCDENGSRKLVLDLIELAPESWLYACGTLNAHWEMPKTGTVSKTVGYVMDDNVSLSTAQYHTPGGLVRDSEITPKDIHAFLLRQQLPRFIRFSDLDHPRMPMATIKQIAPFYVEKGYIGKLFLYKQLDADKQGPAGVFIVSKTAYFFLSLLGKLPRRGSISGKEVAEKNLEFPEDHGPLIKIVWDELYGGRREDIEWAIAVCRMHGLREQTFEELSPFANAVT